MAKRRDEYTGPGYLLGVDKPLGMTSHDVVDKVRRAAKTRRVGHAGTLDPLASGVMVIGVGQATRLLTYLSADRKSYIARIVFGSETQTCDAEGEVTHRAEVPEGVANGALSKRGVELMLSMTEQVPPAYSAVHVDGKRAYDLARQGIDVELESRAIRVFDASFIAAGTLEDGSVFWDVSLDVSKGTYIRSIARDLGRALGSAAYVGSLRRTSSGNVTIGRCVSLDATPDAWRTIDPVNAIGCKIFEFDEADYLAVCDGKRLSYEKSRLRSAPELDEDELLAFVYDNKLHAMMQKRGSALVPVAVFREGILRDAEVVR